MCRNFDLIITLYKYGQTVRMIALDSPNQNFPKQITHGYIGEAF